MSACAESAPSRTREASVSPAPPPQRQPASLRPYRVKGVWYYPAAQPGYDKVGFASWYGRSHHGKRTASGEIFDMNSMTAAHKTLPLHSRVRVTNLTNGRSVEVTINDRGPFVRGRIIDVSRRAAEQLGFKGAGTARVRVQLVDTAGRIAAAAARSGQIAGVARHASGLPFSGADRAYAESAAQHSLEKARSGTTISWQSPDSGHSGSFTPVATFKTETGTWCRNFRWTFSDGRQTRQAHATACRRSDGTWEMMF